MDNLIKNLPTESEFDDSNKALLEYIKIIQDQWTEPKFICPKCNKGGMCKDLTKVLTTMPPSFKYRCYKCGYITYKHY